MDVEIAGVGELAGDLGDAVRALRGVADDAAELHERSGARWRGGHARDYMPPPMAVSG
jgi:hypothetical protein